MKSLFAVICHDARIDASGNPSCDTIFRAISVGSFPYRHPRMMLVGRFEVVPDDLQDRMHIWADLINADGVVLNRVIDDPNMKVGQGYNSNTITFVAEMLNLTFPSPGEYRFSIFGDGVILAELDLTLGLMK